MDLIERGNGGETPQRQYRESNSIAQVLLLTVRWSQASLRSHLPNRPHKATEFDTLLLLRYRVLERSTAGCSDLEEHPNVTNSNHDVYEPRESSISTRWLHN